MTFLLGHLALVTATLFAGAAVYVSLAEHPARLRLDAAAALRQWKPSYVEATKMQASLAAASAVLGLAAAVASGDARWVLGALFMLANLPYTMFGIMPVNKALQAIPDDAAGMESDGLLRRWGRLHLVRDGFGLAAAAAYVWAAS